MNLVIIPARYASQRFPGKPLALIDKIPMIERVYRQVAKAKLVDKIVVATEDIRIQEFVTAFGGNCVMTSANHQSGTDRLAEAVQHFSQAKIVVNVQGDEPLIDPNIIDLAIQPILENNEIKMSTLAFPIDLKNDDINNPNLVKVVLDENQFALYFSRSLIPYRRNLDIDYTYLGHIGLYAFTKECLLKFSKLMPNQLELVESLEQLRALANNIPIKVIIANGRSYAVDIPNDIKVIEDLLAKTIVL